MLSCKKSSLIEKMVYTIPGVRIQSIMQMVLNCAKIMISIVDDGAVMTEEYSFDACCVSVSFLQMQCGKRLTRTNPAPGGRAEGATQQIGHTQGHGQPISPPVALRATNI